MKRGTIFLARTAIVAALYFLLTFVAQPIAFGPLQFRIGEALTLLPLLTSAAIPGLTIGCLLVNILSPYAWWDMLIGTLATLIASALTYFVGKKLKVKPIIEYLIGSIPPIFVNSIILPLMWLVVAGDSAFWLNFILITATQTGTILVLGISLTLVLSKFKFLFNEQKNFEKRKKAECEKCYLFEKANSATIHGTNEDESIENKDKQQNEDFVK